MTTTTGERLPNGPVPALAIPPLEPGDRLTRDEFERRYEAMPELKKAELIEGVFDLHTKRHVYRRSGVREYVVWRVLDRRIDWFVLRGGQYEPLAADDRGVVRSQAFPGLWLDPEAPLRGDLAATLQTLDEGLATAEHAAFVTRLGGGGES
jgi:hypothetical protein